MVGKLCAAPAKGGAASGLIEYLVGYAISEKGATRQEIADALDGVYAESEERQDLGVCAVWRPAASGGTRPFSILVRNCASFATASLEIDADGARNPGIRSSAMHFVWSCNERESGLLTDEQVHAYADEQLAELRAKHSEEETLERDHKKVAGVVAELPSALQERLRELPVFQDAERSEQAIIEQVERNPVMVLIAVTTQNSAFTREDVDQWLSARISDPDEIERLGDLIVRGDEVRVLSADPIQALMTTTEIVAIEGGLDADARHLAATASGIMPTEVDTAIRSYEQQETARRGHAFRLSDEQRTSLQQLSRASLVAIEGLPGVGKTTIQGVVRVPGEQIGREVVGLTLSQTAAERLESEAGFRCLNTARPRILEEGNNPVVPRNGIVVVDEAAMVDSRANGKILELARARGSIVVEIGDVRQLQPIDFGA